MSGGDSQDGEGDEITRKLRALSVQLEHERALAAPRVRAAVNGGRYFLADCPHCHETGAYQHLSARKGPVGAAVELELAWCEQCGVVESWRLLGGLPDGSTRVLGPDFGADPPPSKPPGSR